ncbi:N-(5'-phosphoribosyl)anthranilate isomerase 1, chloroplastic-like [Mangifera indica]|uniref:N-(5'-phosphoribosyl)anthranilate isomerase 1, chloroplastic-like n=1 Tax=Mangifera indica TaxID=29780 RepID=UPI001CF96C3A|nr:N-(5'-phosphoribosyl)anthranilate isomerase 1, chloroplastic-like [Mangifera indica]
MPGSFRKWVWCIGYSSAFKNSAGLFVKNKITCSASQKDEFSSNDEEREKNVPLVSLGVAKDISKVAREYGAEPVVGLRGEASRAAFPKLVQENQIIYVLQANDNGDLLNQISYKDCSLVDWVLAGSAKGNRINPENVLKALSTLKPNGIDVSNGICGSDGIQKDQWRVSSFMNAVQSEEEKRK